MTDPLSFDVELSDTYEDAVERVTAALKEEGFGVLTRIDVRETMKQKLDVDFRPYVILGACNPPLAHKALSAQAMIGTLLPCNVTVEQTEGGALVRIINPDAMLSVGPLSDDDAVCDVASEARARLERVAAALKA